jgi:hypothetical protein
MKRAMTDEKRTGAAYLGSSAGQGVFAGRDVDDDWFVS